MFCESCRCRIADDSAFCRFCGEKQVDMKTPTTITKTEKPLRNKARGNSTGSIYKRNGVWVAEITIGYMTDATGKLHRKSRTKWGFRTKAEAVKYLPTLMENKPKPKESNLTVAQIYNGWFAQHKNRVGKSTMDGYSAAWKYFSEIQLWKMADVLPPDYQRCIDNCDKGKRTKENMKALASLLCKYACDLQIIDRNRAENLFTGNDEKGTRPPFTMKEVEIIRKAAEDGVPYADYVYCMIYTGFRPSEMLELKKTAYNPAEHTLIGGGKTKAGTNRVVPVSPKIEQYIQKRLEAESEFLFPNRMGKEFTLQNFTEEYFKPLMMSLGIKDRTPYSCRHTFANLLKSVSGSDTDKAAIMGHADPSMTKYYQSEEIGPMRNIVEAI